MENHIETHYKLLGRRSILRWATTANYTACNVFQYGQTGQGMDTTSVSNDCPDSLRGHWRSLVCNLATLAHGYFLFDTILKHTQHYTLDSLMLLGAGSNVFQYGARISVQSRSLSPSFADSVHDIDDD